VDNDIKLYEEYHRKIIPNPSLLYAYNVRNKTINERIKEKKIDTKNLTWFDV